MKSETMKITTHDRLATLEEVRTATSFTEDRVFDFYHAQDSFCEMGSDIGGVIRYPAEEFEFFAYLSEMDETLLN